MNNEFTTFKTSFYDGVLTVTINYPPINVLGIKMMMDIDKLTKCLINDNTIKVVVFESSLPEFFISHADIDYLQNLSSEEVPLENVKVNDLAKVLDNLSRVPQVTIAKIDGFARGGGHEFALACDLRYASLDSVFMQMEVGMGLLPCGGGSSRLAKIVGLGKALEIILSARDFNAREAEMIGSINKALEKEKLGEYVFNVAHRISKFPSESIKSCKSMVKASIDMPLCEALKLESYYLYQCTSKSPTLKRFKHASKINFQNDIYNQENFETMLMNLQDIN